VPVADGGVGQDRCHNVAAAPAVLKEPGVHVERLRGDPQRLGDLLEDLGTRLLQAALDLAEIRVRDTGSGGQLAQ
jgi:hypothetical protein